MQTTSITNIDIGLLTFHLIKLHMKYHLASALFALFLFGCASTPKPGGSELHLIESAKRSTIRVYASMTSERSALMDLVVYVNGKNIGVLDDIKSVDTWVNPGETEVVVLPRYKYVGLNGEKSFKYIFNAQPGRSHHIRFHQALESIHFHGTIAVPKVIHSLTETSEENWIYRR